MGVVMKLLQILLRLFLPVLAREARDIAEDSAPPGELEKRLRDKIREDGW